MGVGPSSLSESEDSFHIRGPPDLTSIDWNNLHHKTLVASCLIKGLEQNIPLNPWWDFFNFSLQKTLIDESDNSIYGAVLEHQGNHNTSHSGTPPQYVIVFCGILKLKEWFDKGELRRVRIHLKEFQTGSTSFLTTISETQMVVDKQGKEVVWLAGNSLGAGLALLVGKHMGRSGCPLQTYAFNPPIEERPDTNLFKEICLCGYYATRGIVHLMSEELKKEEEDEALWIPNVYLNQEDTIMSDCPTLGKSSLMHLLVSANLIINMNKMPDSTTVHRLEQWWQQAESENWKSHCIRSTMKKKEIFFIYGPYHLTSIDWTNSYHRNAVVSSLVRGVYILELDRQKKRLGPKALANPWWEFFNFSLLETLQDNESDPPIYCAVFEYKEYRKHSHLAKHPPRYVVAFRGTVLRGETWFEDLKSDTSIFFNDLHDCPRFKKSIERICNIVERDGADVVWLAGHSLGAALALLSGKAMVDQGYTLEAYLFNPPIASCPLTLLKSENVKLALRFVSNYIKATIVKAIGKDKSKEKEAFRRLATWKPHLFVNKLDPISSEYIHHFKNRVTMSENFPNEPNRVTNKETPTSASLEPLHLLPSAILIRNVNKSRKRIGAHSLKQWWDPKTVFKTDTYQL